jgi:hypothetical protein
MFNKCVKNRKKSVHSETFNVTLYHSRFLLLLLLLHVSLKTELLQIQNEFPDIIII